MANGEWQEATEPQACPECESAMRDAAYWRKNYEILRRVIAEQSDDPALLWLDEVVKVRFGLL